MPTLRRESHDGGVVVAVGGSDGAMALLVALESKAEKEQTYKCKPGQLLSEDQDA